MYELVWWALQPSSLASWFRVRYRASGGMEGSATVRDGRGPWDAPADGRPEAGWVMRYSWVRVSPSG